jgi:two-component system, NtrC family, sensor kinase
MIRRSKTRQEPVKGRRRKTAALKRSNGPKTARRRVSPNDSPEITRLSRELNQVREERSAIADVLKLISRSTTDLQSVLNKLVESAARLCEADSAVFNHIKGSVAEHAASYGLTPETREHFKVVKFKFGRGSVTGRALLQRGVAHIRDVRDDPDFDLTVGMQLWGARTLLGVPLLREDIPIGVFVLARHTVRPFMEEQIELATSFAHQAAIAIENGRLLNELRQRTDDLSEALDQQTATSDVLQVISGSPGDLQPVFAAILDKAARICDANFGNIFRWDGDALLLVATHNTPPAFTEHRRRVPFRPNQGNPIADMLKAKTAIHVADLARDERYIQKRDPNVVAAVELGGIRTFVAVPMLKDEKLIGTIILYRQEVRPFSDKQIELVKNFAAQAVIAVENARLLNELRERTTDLSEALEQQTATSDVLQVISSSPSDLQPVFATMLENATRICDAKFGNVYVWDGDGFQLVATHNTPPAFAESRKRGPFRPNPGHPFRDLVETKRFFHIADVAALPGYKTRDPQIVAPVELGGIRTCLGVPMLKDNNLIGALVIFRQEVRPFSDKQIALLTNFAAQAVIAVENARLLNELRQRTDDLTRSLEDLRTTQDRLVQTQKLASLGQLTAGIAHEIKNPLEPAGKTGCTGRE